MEFQITLGGICYNIRCKYPIVKDYFAEFLSYGNKNKTDISLLPEDISNEWHSFIKYDGNDQSVLKTWYEPTLERLAINRKIIEQFPTHSSILMHGVVVCDSDFAYMLTAPSGTGKTTRARLFVENKKDRWILNGDKPLIRVEQNHVIACGTPWKGKENQGVNAEKKLKAIFLLERSDQIKITQISITEAFDFLFHQTFLLSGDNIAKSIQLLYSFEKKVQLFRFCSPASIEAVETAYQIANEQQGIRI